MLKHWLTLVGEGIVPELYKGVNVLRPDAAGCETDKQL